MEHFTHSFTEFSQGTHGHGSHAHTGEEDTRVQGHESSPHGHMLSQSPLSNVFQRSFLGRQSLSARLKIWMR